MGETRTKSALILIDLQNEFLSPRGLLGKNHVLTSTPDLLSNVHQLVQAYTQAGNDTIIWIQSDYSTSTANADASDSASLCPVPRPEGEKKYAQAPLNSAFLQSSHTQQRHSLDEPASCGQLCCQPGTEAFQIHNDLQGTIQLASKSQFVVKRWYSAFKGTSLQDRLKEAGLVEGSILYVAGLTANNCIMATVTDAFFLKYDIILVEDCLGATSTRLKAEALETMTKWYATMVTLNSLPFEEDAILDRADTGREMILYWVNGSIPSWRVMLSLAHKGIKYSAKRLKVMSIPKETRSDTFRSINPRCKTPTLVDTDGTIVIESLAILQYLETYYPSQNPTLLPSKQDKKLYSTVIQRFQESENLHNVCENMELCFLENYEKHRQLIVDSLDGTMEELQFWENYLGSDMYIAGDVFTLADYAFYPVLGYLVHRGLKLKGEFPNLLRYHDKLTATGFAKSARPGGWEKLSKVDLFATSWKLRNTEEQTS